MSNPGPWGVDLRGPFTEPGWVQPPDATRHNPAPWWYTLAARLFPDRCREIPEAQEPDRIVLRQFAIVKRFAYLQQFASSEHQDWMHSHQWRYTFALGLWGEYTERRLAGATRRRRAPYAYFMDSSVIHQVTCPTAGHTSIFVGLFRDDDLKYYYEVVHELGGYWHTGVRRLWSNHVKVMVKRI